MKRQPMECEKIFMNDLTNKRLISKIYKQHNIKKKKKKKNHRILLKSWAQNLKLVTSTKACHMAISNMSEEKDLFSIGSGSK